MGLMDVFKSKENEELKAEIKILKVKLLPEHNDINKLNEEIKELKDQKMKLE